MSESDTFSAVSSSVFGLGCFCFLHSNLIPHFLNGSRKIKPVIVSKAFITLIPNLYIIIKQISMCDSKPSIEPPGSFCCLFFLFNKRERKKKYRKSNLKLPSGKQKHSSFIKKVQALWTCTFVYISCLVSNLANRLASFLRSRL